MQFQLYNKRQKRKFRKLDTDRSTSYNIHDSNQQQKDKGKTYTKQKK